MVLNPRKKDQGEKRKKKPVKGPDDPASVGWTHAQRVRLVEPGESFKLEAGGKVSPVDVEYETYGTLSPARDNVIVLLHALSGDAHAAGWDAEAEATGRKWRTRKRRSTRDGYPGWSTRKGPACARRRVARGGRCSRRNSPAALSPRPAQSTCVRRRRWS